MRSLSQDRERTWICESRLAARSLIESTRVFRFNVSKTVRRVCSLCCRMTELSDRPSMMHRMPDVRAWRRHNPFPLPSDGQLEFAVKWVILHPHCANADGKDEHLERRGAAAAAMPGQLRCSPLGIATRLRRPSTIVRISDIPNG